VSPAPEVAQVVRRVAREDTARVLGSGDLEVLGTPRLLAWCEQATVEAAAAVLTAGRTTVGTRVELAHERASAVGTEVTVRAELVHVDGRLLRFEVVAEQDVAGARAVVARGTVTRVVVDPERFLARLEGSLTPSS
jgi:fluoroacetyl-CoA thioesterase